MKTTKKFITIFLMIVLSVMTLTNSVKAATTNLSMSTSQVTVGDQVSVTISFGGKVDSAQFRLDFDSSKLRFISTSAGSYRPQSNMFAYLNMEGIADLSSVTFTFEAEESGTGTIQLSGLIVAPIETSIGNSQATLTIEEEPAKEPDKEPDKKPDKDPEQPDKQPDKKPDNNTTNKPQNNGNTSGSTDNGTSNKPSQNNGTSDTNKQEDSEKDEDNEEENIIEKPELDALKTELATKVESDYTKQTWEELQDIINQAEKADTIEEYNKLKDKLNISKLIPEKFEKPELDKILQDLLILEQKDYTVESWEDLQNTIKQAQDAKLKSEYEAIKTKLTTEVLIKINDPTTIENEEQQNDNYWSFIIAILIIFIILCAILVVLKRKNKKDNIKTEIPKATEKKEEIKNTETQPKKSNNTSKKVETTKTTTAKTATTKPTETKVTTAKSTTVKSGTEKAKSTAKTTSKKATTKTSTSAKKNNSSTNKKSTTTDTKKTK